MRTEYVDAHGGKIDPALRLHFFRDVTFFSFQFVNRRFLVEFRYDLVLTRLQNAEARGIVSDDGYRRNRDVCVVLDVVPMHEAIVHRVELVTR